MPTSQNINSVILLMITAGKKLHYIAVNKLSALLREVTSKRVKQFNCINCFSHTFG